MRVAVVTESFLPTLNGVTTSVCKVLDHLRSHGHEALVVVPAAGAPSSYAGFRVVEVPAVPYRKFQVGLPSVQMQGLLADFAPDVIHAASPFLLGAQAIGAGRRLGIPTVAIFQTDVAGYARRNRLGAATKFAWRVIRWIHNDADLTLVPSSASMADLREAGLLNLQRWGRGVDLDRYHPRNRALAAAPAVAPSPSPFPSALAPESPAVTPFASESAMPALPTSPVVSSRSRSRSGSVPADERSYVPVIGGLPEDEVVVGYVGRFAPEKQIEKFAALRGMPGVRFVLVGDGPSMGSVRRALAGMPVTYAGELRGEDLAAAYAGFDIFLHTGAHETFGQTLQEAHASGLPVIAPNAGGPIDLVDQGVNGYLFDVGDDAGMRASVELLARDPALRRRMGEAGRRGVVGKSWDSVCAELVQHYRAVIAAARSARRRAGSAVGSPATPSAR